MEGNMIIRLFNSHKFASIILSGKSYEIHHTKQTADIITVILFLGPKSTQNMNVNVKQLILDYTLNVI